MDQATAETIDKYHAEYDKNPSSKVFAPLADAYRKLGQLNQALVIAKNGHSKHPNFSGGHVVLGRIYYDMGQTDKALPLFASAIKADPNNILAHKLLADIYLEEKDIKKALSAYKMVLFFKPSDKQALERIKKLESLSAEDFEEDSFQVKKINFSSEKSKAPVNDKLLERALSLSDAFLVRGEVEKSFNVLSDARKHYGDDPEIIKRLKLINHNIEAHKTEPPLPDRNTLKRDDNINHLKNLLSQIDKLKL